MPPISTTYLYYEIPTIYLVCCCMCDGIYHHTYTYHRTSAHQSISPYAKHTGGGFTKVDAERNGEMATRGQTQDGEDSKFSKRNVSRRKKNGENSQRSRVFDSHKETVCNFFFSDRLRDETRKKRKNSA